MGDARFRSSYERVQNAENRVSTIRTLKDEEVIEALGGASEEGDTLVANFLATEAANRIQRARRALDHVADGVVSLDGGGRLLLINPAAERMLGWLDPEVRGLPVSDVLRVERPSAHEGAAERDGLLRPLRSGETVVLHDALIVRRDGIRFPAQLTAAPVLVEGEPIGVVVAFRDDAERRDAEEPHQRLGAYLEAAPEFVAFATPDLRIREVNPAGLAMTGYTRHDLEAAPPLERFVAQEAWPILRDEGIPAALSRGHWSGIVELCARDGRRFRVSKTILAHRGPDGNVTLLYMVARAEPGGRKPLVRGSEAPWT